MQKCTHTSKFILSIFTAGCAIYFDLYLYLYIVVTLYGWVYFFMLLLLLTMSCAFEREKNDMHQDSGFIPYYSSFSFSDSQGRLSDQITLQLCYFIHCRTGTIMNVVISHFAVTHKQYSLALFIF